MGTEIVHEKTPDSHATLVGGSSAKRVMNCTASVGILARMQAQLDAEADAILRDATPGDLGDAVTRANALRGSLNKSSTYADEGTALHEVMAYIVENDIQRDDIINDPKIDELWQRYALDDARLWDCVFPAFEAFNKKCDELLAEGDDPDNDELLIGVEKRCEMPGVVDKNGVPQFGSCDVLIRGPKRTAVWDWKFGSGVPVYASYKVESPQGNMIPPEGSPYFEYGNDQLMFYARAAMHSFPQYFGAAGEGFAKPDWSVDLVICAPRMIEDGAVSEFTTDVETLEEFRLDLADAVEEALGPNPVLAKGSWCRFEACKTVCPLHISAAEKAGQIGEKLGRLQMQVAVSREANAAPMTTLNSTEELERNETTYAEALAAMLDIAEIVEPYIKEAQSQAHAFLEAGGRIPGYKLVPKRAAGRSWKEDRTKVDAFLSRQGLDLEARREAWEPISPAQAEKKLKAAGLDLKEGSKDRKLLDKYIAPGVSSGSTLAPADDPRPEFVRTADRVAELAGKLKGIAGA